MRVERISTRTKGVTGCIVLAGAFLYALLAPRCALLGTWQEVSREPGQFGQPTPRQLTFLLSGRVLQQGGFCADGASYRWIDKDHITVEGSMSERYKVSFQDGILTLGGGGTSLFSSATEKISYWQRV